MKVIVRLFDCLHKCGVAWENPDGSRASAKFDIHPHLVERIRTEGIQVSLDREIIPELNKISYEHAKTIRKTMARRIKKENKNKALPRVVPMSADIMDTVNTYIEIFGGKIK